MLDRIEALLDMMVRSVDSRTTVKCKLDLITYRSYTIENTKNVTNEMADWLAAHDRKPEDIKWGSCADGHEWRFVGQLKGVVMTGAELDSLTTKDSFIINICGHPWYIASRPEEVHNAGSN